MSNVLQHTTFSSVFVYTETIPSVSKDFQFLWGSKLSEEKEQNEKIINVKEISTSSFLLKLCKSVDWFLYDMECCLKR